MILLTTSLVAIPGAGQNTSLELPAELVGSLLSSMIIYYYWPVLEKGLVALINFLSFFLPSRSERFHLEEIAIQWFSRGALIKDYKWEAQSNWCFNLHFLKVTSSSCTCRAPLQVPRNKTLRQGPSIPFLDLLACRNVIPITVSIFLGPPSLLVYIQISHLFGLFYFYSMTILPECMIDCADMHACNEQRGQKEVSYTSGKGLQMNMNHHRGARNLIHVL